MKKLTNPHEAELDEMREIFSLVDKDGGGTISNEELSELFSIVGIEASDEDLDEMIRQMDEDNSGEIKWMKTTAARSILKVSRLCANRKFKLLLLFISHYVFYSKLICLYREKNLLLLCFVV
jgi:hypothetical protein